MNLKFRGRKGFVKDWLLNESKKDPIFGELYKRMEVDEELQQYLEKIGTDDLSGDTSSLNDNVERKKDVEQLQKSIKIGKRELKSIEEKIEAYNAELLSWNQKIEEIKHFLPAGTRYSRSQYDLS
ncbi:hypothetical protein BC829DRAFT_157341 [Chytridium lagenaria]|nr:hypothetical protein BC829DRAFT_157341 [Chytridium lagenaria]